MTLSWGNVFPQGLVVRPVAGICTRLSVRHQAWQTFVGRGIRGPILLSIHEGTHKGTHKGCPYGRLAHLRANGKRGFSGMGVGWGGLRTG